MSCKIVMFDLHVKRIFDETTLFFTMSYGLSDQSEAAVPCTFFAEEDRLILWPDSASATICKYHHLPLIPSQVSFF